jgi:hypothetical protein
MTEIDVERLDSIMGSVLQLREERGYVPPRDEEKIAEILHKWNLSADEQHKLLVESKQQFAAKVRHQVAANKSEKLKEFPSI